MPSAAENAKIVAAAKADPDAQPMTKAQLEVLVPLRAVRGRPKLENKKLLLSVRYSAEVVEYFRATGEGWQARMDVCYGSTSISILHKKIRHKSLLAGVFIV